MKYHQFAIQICRPRPIAYIFYRNIDPMYNNRRPSAYKELDMYCIYCVIYAYVFIYVLEKKKQELKKNLHKEEMLKELDLHILPPCNVRDRVKPAVLQCLPVSTWSPVECDCHLTTLI